MLEEGGEGRVGDLVGSNFLGWLAGSRAMTSLESACAWAWVVGCGLWAVGCGVDAMTLGVM